MRGVRRIAHPRVRGEEPDVGDERRAARLRLPPMATSPAAARAFVAETLAAWGAEGGEDALLVVSELVTNALLHARTPMVVTLVDELPDAIRLAVGDGSTQPPQQRHFSLESGTGRGLRLLAALAAEWGVVHDGAGKTVWCRLALGEPASYAAFDVDAVDAL